MALTLTLTTELEAVNQMLEIIGERPVNDLDSTVLNAAKVAQQRLHFTSRRIQSKGWPCNKDTDFTMTPDGSQTISVPLNVLSLDPTDASQDYVVREGKLYDRDKQTFTFDKPVKVTLVWFQSFTDLPEILRSYIYIVAGREFQARFLTSDTLHIITEKDEKEAWKDLRRWKMRVNDQTIFNNTPVARISRRTFNPQRS